MSEILNIVGRRVRRYRWKKITVIAEAASHDNSCKDTDRAKFYGGMGYEELPKTSLSDAIVWASTLPFQATLYLYDYGKGINVARRTKIRELRKGKA